MAMQGRTLTRHFHIETRQHEIFNYDLGEGIPRRMFVFGMCVTAAWVLILSPILGLPNKYTFSIYAMPPVVFAYFGYQESNTQARRRNITQWAIKSRYMTVGHRPIISLGGRAAYRSEYLPLSERIPFEAAIRRLIPWLLPPEWEEDHKDDHTPKDIQTGRPIALIQTATIYGFDQMEALRSRGKALPNE